jgi:glutamyl-Q tRNA(Asp) synthetase
MTAALAPAGPTVTRFAPSPTGHLHLGHAYAALFAADAAGPAGRFLLRIEDIDRGRAREEFVDAIFEDLGWLGLAWETPVWRQSARFAHYQRALDALGARGLLYPCFCTRAAIRREIGAAVAAPHGPDGPLYPGTCRGLSPAERTDRIAAGAAFAWRLDVARAAHAAGPLAWTDRDAGETRATPEIFGDVVLARKDVPASYHLACTVDDAAQGITLVTRGRDLFAATHLHRLLQALLGLPTPAYAHHGLVLGPDGRKLSKRDRPPTLRALRQAGQSPASVRAMALASTSIASA